MPDQLPLDVTYNNILPRLPVKSLIRFKTVSKQWHSFLKSRFFANMHLNRVTNDDHQKHHKFLKISREGPFEFCTIDCETLEVGASRPFPFKVSFGQIFGEIWIESSCNGLVFLILKNDNMLPDLILWNPLTSDYKTLAKTDINKKLHNRWGTKFELYYSSCDEDYKLVCVTSTDHDVFIYSLKTDSWRKVNSYDACQCIPNLISSDVKQGTCLNENLYLLERNCGEYLITKFDTKIKKFTKITTPFMGDQIWSGLIVQGGCIHLYVKSHHPFDSPIELWMMRRDGDWMRVSTSKNKLYDKNPFLHPLHLTRDGTWLMKSRATGELYKVKKHKGETCKDTLNGTEEARYIPTFLSPNQYMS